MKKYWDVDQDRIWTEDELRDFYEKLKRSGDLPDFYDDFNYYLEACLDKNGSLTEIADDWIINRLRRTVASEIACKEMPYDKCLEVICRYNMFGTWSAYEVDHRPVNIDEATEIVGEYLGLY